MIFLNDGPVGGAEVLGDRKERLGMVKDWHAAAAPLAVERHFTLEPVVYYRVDETTEHGVKGEIDRLGKITPLTDFLDSLGEDDILIVFSGPSLTAELLRRVRTQRFRTASAPGITPGVPGFEAAYDRIPLRAEALNMRFDMAEAAVVDFSSEAVPGFPKEGMQCSFDLRGQTFHILENGECRMPGRLINLPSGCANIAPYPDGEDQGPSRTQGELPLDYNGDLLTLTVDTGRITDFNGQEDGVDFWKEKLADPRNALITKLGLGLNDDCRVMGVRVVDEKTMGFHFGYGPFREFPCVYTEHGSIHATVRLLYPQGREETIMEKGRYRSDVLGAVFPL